MVHGVADKRDLFRHWFPEEDIDQLMLTINWPQDKSIAKSKITQRTSSVLKLPVGIVPLLDSEPHCQYLRGRNLIPERLAHEYKVQAIISGSLADRHLFPVLNLDGKPVTWTTRSIIGAEPKYKAARLEESVVSVKNVLFGEHLCRYDKPIILVEGIFDALRVNTATSTFGYCAASFGTHLTKQQVLKLAEYPRRIVCFDSEPTAQEDATELGRQLAHYGGVTEIVQLDSEDPGSASTTEITRLLKYAGHM